MESTTATTDTEKGPVRRQPTAASGRVAARLERARRRDTLLRRLLAAGDVLALAIALVISLALLGEERMALPLVAAPLALVVLAKLRGLYDRDPHLIHRTTLDEVPALFTLSALAVLLLFLTEGVLIEGNFQPRQGVGTLLILFGSMVALRAGARRVWRLRADRERCLLVGDALREQELREALRLTESAHVELVDRMPMPTAADDPSVTPVPDEVLDELDIDRVVFAPGSHTGDELMLVIRELRDAGVKVSVIPDVSRLAGSSVEVDVLGGMTLLGMRRFAITRSSRVIKRAFDLSAATLLLALLAPLMVAIAVAIRIEGPGSRVLFRQRRIGRGGESFEMLKFRSMRDGSHGERPGLRELDRGAPGLFKIPDDPRVTRVGRWIRRTNLDELPQLINVLRGEMSLVGPRPLVPEEDRNVPEVYRRRLDVRPGITGHWQVLGSARVPLEEMVKLDYLYVANWSLWGDLVLIVRTIPLMARGRGM